MTKLRQLHNNGSDNALIQADWRRDSHYVFLILAAIQSESDLTASLEICHERFDLA